MNDFELKRLISKLTGVRLVKQAMADVPNVPLIAERDMKWQRYTGGELHNVPDAMRGEIERLFKNFAEKFAASGGQANSGEKLVYAYYAADPILNDQQKQAISGNPQFVELLKFMEDHGLRLWSSPAAMHQWAARNRKPYNPSGTNGGVGADGKDKYFENFGYAWGARKVAVNRNVRRADYIPPEKAQRLLDPSAQYEMESNNLRLVQLVTAQKNNAWGIFFKDTTGKLYPVIGDNYYAQGKLSQEDTGFADPGLFAATKGQHKKFFGYHDEAAPRGVSAVMPTQTQFMLSNGPQDPRPQPVRRGTLSDSARGDRYYLWIRNDGTLWWLKAAERGAHLKGGQSQPIPLTAEQVDFFNIHKNEYWQLANPDVEVYDWSTVPEDMREQEQQDYQAKTTLMNQMYDTLMQSGMEPKVHLNAFKYVIVGPAFQSGENIGEQKTRGQFLYPTTVDKGEGHDLGENTVVRRRDWIRVANEFNAGRAEKTGAKGYIPQAMSGKGAQDAEETLKQALVEAFKAWNINAPFPPEDEINAAQLLFDKIHYPQLVNQNQPNAVPEAPPDMGNELMGTPGGEMPETPQAPAAPQPVGQPQQPAQPAVKVWQQPGTLAQGNAFTKTSSDILKQLRKLG
jgi:hypothetical protein